MRKIKYPGKTVIAGLINLHDNEYFRGWKRGDAMRWYLESETPLIPEARRDGLELLKIRSLLDAFDQTFTLLQMLELFTPQQVKRFIGLQYLQLDDRCMTVSLTASGLKQACLIAGYRCDILLVEVPLFAANVQRALRHYHAGKNLLSGAQRAGCKKGSLQMALAQLKLTPEAFLKLEHGAVVAATTATYTRAVCNLKLVQTLPSLGEQEALSDRWQRLSNQQRLALSLRASANQTYTQIAKALGYTVSEIDQMIAEALAELSLAGKPWDLVKRVVSEQVQKTGTKMPVLSR